MKHCIPFIILSALVLSSCNSATKKEPTRQLPAQPGPVELPVQSSLTSAEQDAISDSLDNARLLDTALEIAGAMHTSIKFSREINLSSDSNTEKRITLRQGKFFGNASYYLEVHRFNAGNTRIDFFLQTDTGYQPLLSHLQWSMEYINDSIRDVNGDGRKDFIVNWYGTNGCCLKAYSVVYLQRAEKDSFSAPFEFINPHFFPAEKAIRGVEYGHPGKTDMYQYKWSGENVDTVEYVRLERDSNGKKTGYVLILAPCAHGAEPTVLRKLKNAPVEYRSVEGYSWFEGKN